MYCFGWVWALYGEVYGSGSEYDEVVSGGAESESAHVKLETGCVDVERTCVEMETGYVVVETENGEKIDVDVEMLNGHVEIEKNAR